MFKTADILDDNHEKDIQILNQKFNFYGKKEVFYGEIFTVSCFEDNSFVKKSVELDGTGKIMVIDGKASMNCALLGDMLAEKAFKNNWSGVIVNGCIRDSDIIKDIDIGVLALSTNPQKSEKKDVGEVNIELNFFNTSFIPGHYLYADLDGLLVSKTKIDI